MGLAKKIFKISRYHITILILLTLFFILAILSVNPLKSYNVVLITMDAVRPDYLGAYGYSTDVSPNFGLLAEESIVFEHVVANGEWTRPSIYSLMTGKYPNLIKPPLFFTEPLDDLETTLAEILRENGFLTQAFTNWVVLWPELGIGRGFDDYSFLSNLTLDKWINDSEMNEEILDWLDENYQEQFFLYTHYTAAHAVNHMRQELFIPQGEAFDGCFGYDSKVETVKCLYEITINQTDFLIGSLVDKLKQLGIYDNTILIITSDHGEQIFEKLNLFGHYEVSLYNEVVAVPLITHLPGFEDNLRIETRVQLADIFPTILDILNISYEGELSGQSLMPLILGEEWIERYLLSGYIYNFYWIPYISFSDENESTEIGKFVYYDRNLTTSILNLERNFGFQSNMSLYPQQMKLSRPDKIVGLFKCDDNYIYISMNSSHNESLTGFDDYFNSASCDPNDRMSSRYVIGNFSIDYPLGEEMDKELNLTNHIISVFFDKWKYIHTSDGPEELYDLSQDPHELDNVILDYPDIAENFYDYILSYIDSIFIIEEINQKLHP